MLLLLAGCTSGEYTGEPTSPVPSLVTTTTTAPVVGQVMVRGVVAQTLASARVIVLTEEVSGFGNVALTAGTEVVRAGGAKAAITDIAPRSTIEATGRPGTAGTLVAERVVLL